MRVMLAKEIIKTLQVATRAAHRDCEFTSNSNFPARN